MKLKRDSVEGEMEELKKGLDHLCIEYNDHILEKFKRYVKILYEYKNKIHLLSHQDYNRISKRHFLISLMALPYIKGHNNACDIGVGAGFPSIPLKILRPEISFTLFESKQKKAEFLKYLTGELNLSKIQIINDRAENYTSGKFDLILIKAAGKIRKLIKVIDYLILQTGKAVFYKSIQVEDEIRIAEKEIKKRGFQVQVIKLSTPIENLPLTLVMLKRT